MSKRRLVSVLFLVSALYDGLLGLAFLASPGAVFERYGVTPPNHFGYVQFPAALLVVFGLMFLAVARDPERNRNLIPYGILLKVSYCAVVTYYWTTTGVPDMWKPFAAADLVFLAAFVWAYRAAGSLSSPPSAAPARG